MERRGGGRDIIGWRRKAGREVWERMGTSGYIVRVYCV